MKQQKELRYIPFDEFELREDEDGPHLIGYASIFNVEAVIFGLWREMVAPGAFKKTIKENDIRALWNHNTDKVLGRNKASTLVLREDEKGLKVDITPPDTQAGRDAVTSIKRGDVSQMSIMFERIKQEWFYPEDKKELPLRTMKEMKLYEVSPVTFPAFEQTSISARSGLLLPDGDIDPLEEARRLLRCAERGFELSKEQREIIRAAVELYQPYLLEPEFSGDDNHSEESEPEQNPDENHHSNEPSEPESSHWESQPDEHYSAEERERRLKEISKSIFIKEM
jgi:uncharacterized protein